MSMPSISDAFKRRWVTVIISTFYYIFKSFITKALEYKAGYIKTLNLIVYTCVSW